MNLSLKRRQLLGSLFALGLGLSSLASCRPSSQGTPTPSGGTAATEIEFWTMQLQPEFTDYFNQLIQTFETANPEIQVRWVDVPWASMESKILTAVSAGTAPDVVNLNPNFASQLAANGAWLTLDDRVPVDIQGLYLPNIWKASTLNGKTFGLPWYLTTRVTIYNTDLLKQAGVEQPPTTYADLATVARQIKEKTGKYAFFTTVVPEDSAEILESFVQMGVTLVDGEGKAAFNTPAGKAAFQYWVDLYQQELLPREVLTQGHRRAIELYQAGDTAILASGAEFLKTITNNAPQIAKVSAVVPQITGETGKKNVAVMNVVIPNNTRHPEAALKFALFVTNNENQLTFAKAANVLPSTQKALKEGFIEATPSDASPIDRARAISAAQMEQAEVLIPAMKDVKTLQKILYNHLQAAMLKEQTVEEAITEAEQEWNDRR